MTKKVLYVTASCLTRNTSANMSHNSYVQGLLENGASVEIVMAADSWGKQDDALPVFSEATYHVYRSQSLSLRLRNLFHRVEKQTQNSVAPTETSQQGRSVAKVREPSAKALLRAKLKKLFYALFPQDPIYPLDGTWLRHAKRFRSQVCYDLVVSNSSPSASHRLVADLLKKKHIHCKRWVQIWEDPWYHDLYGGHSEAVLREEHALLRAAQEVCYVSPLTLHYQQQLFPDCAAKMRFIALPYLRLETEREHATGAVSFGYFGDYYSNVRNLQPFYDVVVEKNVETYIYGATDLHLPSTGHVSVSGRVTLDVLRSIQQRTTVLVHLCNLRGGQIPGKIYHYSATEKPILFILDGTDEEKALIKEFFSHYHRYVFCNNDKDSIMVAISQLTSHIGQHRGFVVKEFSPKQVVAPLLNATA